MCIRDSSQYIRPPSPTRALTPGIDTEAEVSDEPSALRVGEENGD